MGHIDREMLVAYWENRVEEKVRSDIEDHLSGCDVCLRAYLSCCEASPGALEGLDNGREGETAGLPLGLEMPSQEFTARVLTGVKEYQGLRGSKAGQPNRRSQAGGQRHLSRKQLLQYYAVAASITLVLTYTGFFNQLGNRFSDASAEMLKTTQQAEALFTSDWTAQLTDLTVQWIQKINVVQRSEKGHEGK